MRLSSTRLAWTLTDWRLLDSRTPHFSFETLRRWYNSDHTHHVARVFQYWINRVEMDVELLEENEDITRNWCAFSLIVYTT